MSASRRLHLVPQVGCSMLVAVPCAWCCHVHLLCACVYCHATVTSWHPPFTAQCRTPNPRLRRTQDGEPAPNSGACRSPAGIRAADWPLLPTRPPSQSAPQQGFRFQTFLRLPPTLGSKFCTQPGLRRSPFIPSSPKMEFSQSPLALNNTTGTLPHHSRRKTLRFPRLVRPSLLHDCCRAS
jgi:hypothetical protein